MAGKYVLKRASTGEFMFNLFAANGEIILTSERYVAKDGAETGITAVRTNSPKEERYDRRTSRSDQHYFVLKAANHEPIGTSEMYSSASARDQGIASVKTNGSTSVVIDET